MQEDIPNPGDTTPTPPDPAKTGDPTETGGKTVPPPPPPPPTGGDPTETGG
jgi:hypothetical protein